MKTFSNVFNETLRISTPTIMTSIFTVTENMKLGNMNLKEGVQLSIFHKYVHMDPEQWLEPDKFVPERFDPQSPFYLTPSGTKRHPMSFIPWLGGKRICLGKTFAELSTRIIGPHLLWKFDFEFVDKQYETYKPPLHSLAPDPVVMVRIKKR
jgi:cytochrome P450